MSLPNCITAQWRLWGRENRRSAHGGGPSGHHRGLCGTILQKSTERNEPQYLGPKTSLIINSGFAPVVSRNFFFFFCPTPQWFDCFCPHFAEKWWCKRMLELAAHCASNVAALADPQKKLVLMVLGSRALILVGLLLLKDKAPKLGQGFSLSKVWTLS